MSKKKKKNINMGKGRVVVIGAGFSGISAAAYLAKEGHEVHVFEKNATPGGRARQLMTSSGFVFDMGPSWYWMPDIFQRFFADFNCKCSDFYDLRRLDRLSKWFLRVTALKSLPVLTCYAKCSNE